MRLSTTFFFNFINFFPSLRHARIIMFALKHALCYEPFLRKRRTTYQRFMIETAESNATIHKPKRVGGRFPCPYEGRELQSYFVSALKLIRRHIQESVRTRVLMLAVVLRLL